MVLGEEGCDIRTDVLDTGQLFVLINARDKKFLHVVLHDGGHSAIGQGTSASYLSTAQKGGSTSIEANLGFDGQVVPQYFSAFCQILVRPR